jgi:hypothetical protein
MKMKINYNAPTEDNFAAAFEQITEADAANKPLDQLPVGDPAPPAGTPPAGSADDTAQAREPASAGGDQQGSDDAGTGDDAGKAAAGDDAATGDAPAGDDTAGDGGDEHDEEADKAVLARLAALVNKAPAPAPVEPQRAPAPPPAPNLYSPEEQEFLASYDKDWNDVVKGEALKRRAEYNFLAQHIFGEFSKVVAPLMEQVRELSTRTHLGDLEATVPDYNDVRDRVVDWVGKQPEYLQVAYNRVIQQGTVDEVKDLISRWRTENGGAAPAASKASAPAKKQDTELPSATKQAADELAPVGSKRSVVQSGSDPNDFEGAFKQFADKVN